LQLDAAWGEPEGASPLCRAEGSERVSTYSAAAALGTAVAQRLRDAGARTA